MHLNVVRLFNLSLRRLSQNESEPYRRLQLIPQREDRLQRLARHRAFQQPTLPPRSNRQPVQQDWPSVWPTAKSFRASVVPLPVRMGYQKPASKKPPPDKHANLELIKIPNFLHLTPSAVKRQCDAIKKFCTPWPSELATEDACNRHLPIQLEYSDYVHSGSSLRDPKYRVVTLKLSLEAVPLSARAKDKAIKLLGDRYDKKTNTLAIKTDSCPTRSQNQEYALYLLTVVLHEANKHESWEDDFEEEDLLRRYWERNKSVPALLEIFAQRSPNFRKESPSLADVKQREEVKNYITAWEAYMNDKEESDESIKMYAESVRKLLSLPKGE